MGTLTCHTLATPLPHIYGRGVAMQVKMVVSEALVVWGSVVVVVEWVLAGWVGCAIGVGVGSRWLVW